MTTQLAAGTTVVGRYRIIEELGRGGNGSVHRAHDQRLDTDIALKVLWPQLAGDATFVERFRREAQTLAKLSHPNILRLFELGEDEDLHVYFLVLEYLTGGTLKDRLGPSPWGLDESLELLRPVATAHGTGLRAHAHALGGVLTLSLLVSACQPAPPTPELKVVPAPAQVVGQTAVSVARVELLQGTAESRATAQGQWVPATGSFDINPGAEFRTGPQGHASVSFADGSRLTVDPSSQVGLELFDTDGTPDAITARLARVRLQNANVGFDIKPVPGASVFEFRTDDQVAVIRGTSGTISNQAAGAGQTNAGSLELVMTQGTALVGCVVQDATGAPKVNILQAGLGQPVRASSGSCQAVKHARPESRHGAARFIRCSARRAA